MTLPVSFSCGGKISSEDWLILTVNCLKQRIQIVLFTQWNMIWQQIRQATGGQVEVVFEIQYTNDLFWQCGFKILVEFSSFKGPIPLVFNGPKKLILRISI